MADIWECWEKTSTRDGFMIASNIISVFLILLSVFVLQQFVNYSISLNNEHTVNISKKKMDILIICTIILSIITMCFYSWFRILLIGVEITTDASCNISEKIFSKIRIGTSLIVLSYYMALVCYFYRLIIIFEGSLFEISKNTKLIFYITNCLSIIQWITARVLLWFLPNSNIGYIMVWGVSVYYIFLIILLCICLKQQFTKISRLSISISNNINNVKADGSSATIVNGTTQKRDGQVGIDVRRKQKFLKVLKRLTVLTYFSVVMTVVDTMIIIAMDAIIRVIMGDESQLTEIIATLCVLIDMVITMICLVLQFPLQNIMIKWIYAKCCYRLERCSMCEDTANMNGLELQTSSIV